MKIPILKKKLSHTKDEDILKGFLFVYKALPKSRKEEIDDDLVAILDGVKKDTKIEKKEEVINLDYLFQEIDDFLENANQGYYFRPNSVIPKSHRSSWRFDVKKYYKILTSIPESDPHFREGTKKLYEIYKTMCEGCNVYLFSNTDTFRSIQVEQPTFYGEVLKRYQTLGNSNENVREMIELALNDGLSSIHVISDQTDVYLSSLQSQEQKEVSMTVLKEIIESTEGPLLKDRKAYRYTESYKKEEKINYCCDMVLSLAAIEHKAKEEYSYYFLHRKTTKEQALFDGIHSCLRKWGSEEDVREFYDYGVKKRNIKPREGILDRNYHPHKYLADFK